MADRHYTVGSNELRLNELREASRLFPFDHYYRLGVAQLIIRDNVWYTPEQAIPLLNDVLKYDPHSKYVTAWRNQYLARQQQFQQSQNVAPIPQWGVNQ